MEFLGFFIIFVLVFSMLCYLYNKISDPLLGDAGDPTYFILSIISLLLSTLAFMGISNSLVNEQKYTREDPVVSMSDHTHLEGDFVLGTGHIDGKMYYTHYVYYEEKDAYERKKIEAENTFIKETDQVEPHIVHHHVKTAPNDEGLYNWFHVNFKKREKSVMYVPKGTIIKQFRLNN